MALSSLNLDAGILVSTIVLSSGCLERLANPSLPLIQDQDFGLRANTGGAWFGLYWDNGKEN